MVMFDLNNRLLDSFTYLYMKQRASFGFYTSLAWTNFLVEFICENNLLKGFISDCINRA